MENNFIKGMDYIGVGVIYFCHDGKGNILMAKRSINARDENGRWDIGGGAIEFGMNPEETLKKEIMEEYCTDCLGYEFLGFRDVHREHNGRHTHCVVLDYKVLVDPKKVKIGEPHKFDDIGWFRIDAMPPPAEIHSQFPKFLELYKNKLA
jgi:8-oxo-dGTP pyrophosphatase MutT (NUDIX family)